MTKPPKPPRSMIRAAEAADIARVDRTTIRNWAAQGKINHRWVDGWLWVSAKTIQKLGWVRSDLVLKKAAARMLGVSPKTLAGWVREGRISCVVTPGGHQRFVRAELERWVEEGVRVSLAPAFGWGFSHARRFLERTSANLLCVLN